MLLSAMIVAYTHQLLHFLFLLVLSDRMIINWLPRGNGRGRNLRRRGQGRIYKDVLSIGFAWTSYPSYGLRKKARLWQKRVNWTWNCWEVSSTELREREVCAAIETAVYGDEDIIIVHHCKVIQFFFHQLLVVVRQPMDIIRSGEALLTFMSSVVLYYSMRAICSWRVERLT